MQIEFEGMDGIDKEGNCRDGGAVEPKGFARLGMGQGCGVPNCRCSEGYWITMGSQVIGGKRLVARAVFESKEEMQDFFREKEAVVV